jgi:hypothetical protein
MGLVFKTDLRAPRSFPESVVVILFKLKV